MTMVGIEKGNNMGKSRKYIEDKARTLMGQLCITQGEVGVDDYPHHIIRADIRTVCHKKIFLDLRHERLETLALTASFGIPGIPGEQEAPPEWDKLHRGETNCTLSHVHYHEKHWLDGLKKESPEAVIRHMAASAIVAAMYDLVVRKEIAKNTGTQELVPAA